MVSGLPNSKPPDRETYHLFTGQCWPPFPLPPSIPRGGAPVVGPLHHVYCMAEDKWEHIFSAIFQGRRRRGAGYTCAARYLSLFFPWGRRSSEMLSQWISHLMKGIIRSRKNIPYSLPLLLTFRRFRMEGMKKLQDAFHSVNETMTSNNTVLAKISRLKNRQISPFSDYLLFL